MIHRIVQDGDTEPTYVTSTDQVAREGVYDSERAARYSFRFHAETLNKLQASVNPGGVITFEMLRDARADDRLVETRWAAERADREPA